jgi:hypothetical protein
MEQNSEFLFMQLILQNQQIAMISMGKLKNPMSDNIERNMDYAKMSIDTLDMLLVKTKGNLSDYESRFLNEVLKDLKLNYVDELNKDKQSAPAPAEEKKEPDPAQ